MKFFQLYDIQYYSLLLIANNNNNLLQQKWLWKISQMTNML